MPVLTMDEGQALAVGQITIKLVRVCGRRTRLGIAVRDGLRVVRTEHLIAGQEFKNNLRALPHGPLANYSVN
jgi:hypothetical protein